MNLVFRRAKRNELLLHRPRNRDYRGCRCEKVCVVILLDCRLVFSIEAEKMDDQRNAEIDANIGDLSAGRSVFSQYNVDTLRAEIAPERDFGEKRVGIVEQGTRQHLHSTPGEWQQATTVVAAQRKISLVERHHLRRQALDVGANKGLGIRLDGGRNNAHSCR